METAASLEARASEVGLGPAETGGAERVRKGLGLDLVGRCFLLACLLACLLGLKDHLGLSVVGWWPAIVMGVSRSQRAERGSPPRGCVLLGVYPHVAGWSGVAPGGLGSRCELELLRGVLELPEDSCHAIVPRAALISPICCCEILVATRL